LDNQLDSYFTGKEVSKEKEGAKSDGDKPKAGDKDSLDKQLDGYFDKKESKDDAKEAKKD